jgi:energy-coupling factor transporter ATP-binding protein EcfA2
MDWRSCLFIEADGLTYSYRGEGEPVAALRGISFCLERGECLGIVGGPGAGKSTLARLLAGLAAPDGGRLAVDDRCAAYDRSSRRRLMERVGYVPQWPERQLFARTVAEDVSAGLTRGRKASPWQDGKVDAALALAGLDPAVLRNRPVISLSGAEARKAALAGILILDRPVLLLDEPTAGLDAVSRREFTALTSRLKGEGRTLVIISHRLADLLPVVDRLLVLEAGRRLFFGAAREAMDDPGLTASGALQWPPLVDLMNRLRKRAPEKETLILEAGEAAREILRFR